MSARDELARDIFTADNSRLTEEQAHAEWIEWSKGGIDPKQNYCYGIADGLIAKGYAKPRETVSYVVITRDGRFVKDFGDNKQAAADYAAEQTADCKAAGINYDYRVAKIVEAQA